jgi:hypothetical protein
VQAVKVPQFVTNYFYIFFLHAIRISAPFGFYLGDAVRMSPKYHESVGVQTAYCMPDPACLGSAKPSAPHAASSHQRSPRSRSTVSTKAWANVPTSSALAPYLMCRTVISRMSCEKRGKGGRAREEGEEETAQEAFGYQLFPLTVTAPPPAPPPGPPHNPSTPLAGSLGRG